MLSLLVVSSMLVFVRAKFIFTFEPQNILKDILSGPIF